MTILDKTASTHYYNYIGREIRQFGNNTMTTGCAQYIADKNLPEQLYAYVVRSSVAHAHIRSRNKLSAQAVPGVVAVFTAADMPAIQFPIRIPMADTPGAQKALQSPLAVDRARYVGEPLALVIAEDAAAAARAGAVMEFDLEELAPVLDLESADRQPAIHSALPDNVVETLEFRNGDVDKLLDGADVVIEKRLTFPRVTGAPMECRGLLADWDSRLQCLTVWGAAKVKHSNSEVLAGALGLAPGQVRLVETNVGGGFGVRGEFYPEDFLIPFAAMQLGRPVKWTESRGDHFLSINHARQQTCLYTIAATASGELLCFRVRAWCDQGAFVRTQGTLPTLLPAIHLPGPYNWRGFDIVAKGVITNRVPVGTVRAPGVTEATYMRETMLDQLARRLAIDPADLRLRNLITPEQMPIAIDMGADEPIVYESGDFVDGFRRMLTAGRYAKLREHRKHRSTDRIRFGVGVSAFAEIGSVGPFEEARIEYSEGLFHIYVGVASVGQPVGTTLAQIGADQLQVSLDSVVIHHHDTADTPYGFGSFASRSTTMAGNAISIAARTMRAKVREHLAIVDDSEPDLAECMMLVPAKFWVAHGRFEKEHPSFSFGAGLAFVLVDTLKGQVKVLHYTLAYDVGRAVNPLLLRDQLRGAVVQGMGAALFEELRYDAAGRLLTKSLDDYLLPTVYDAPEVDIVILEYPVESNPLGLKGGGEAGVASVPAAVSNAVADALESDRVAQLPLNPVNILESLV